MAQMATAVAAHNLCSLHAKRPIGVSRHSAWNRIEEGRPSAARLELVVRLVEGRVAASASVGALLGVVLVIFAGKGGFGALLAQNAELLCSRKVSVSHLTLMARCRGCSRTWVELCLPFAFALLHGIRHLARLGG